MDIWGAIYRTQWSGLVASHEIERDDGRVDRFESASSYFEVPRSDAERELLDEIDGPVLDVAAGAGSYTLYLQEKGLEVVAAEFSAGAREVCRARGCRKVVSIDLRAVQLDTATFASVIVMGNTLGAHQTPETLPTLLRALRGAVRPRGRLLFTMIDPLDTRDESHLGYQRRNRERGIPPVLIRLRIRYQGLSGEWMYLWMLTDDEPQGVTSQAGWVRIAERKHGPWRVRLYENTAS